MLDLIGQIFSLIVLILGEYFAAKKRAREAQEKYEFDQASFNEMVRLSMEKLKERAKQENQHNVDDDVDADLKKRRDASGDPKP